MPIETDCIIVEEPEETTEVVKAVEDQEDQEDHGTREDVIRKIAIDLTNDVISLASEKAMQKFSSSTN